MILTGYPKLWRSLAGASVAAIVQASVAAGAEPGPNGSADVRVETPSPVALAAVTAPEREELTVYLAIGIAHTDLILPRLAFETAPHLVKTAVERAPPGQWVIIGWGPYWFGRKSAGGAVQSGLTRSLERVVTLAAPQRRSQIRLETVPSLPAVSKGNGGPLLPVRMRVAGFSGALRRIDATFVADSKGEPVLADQSDAEPGAILYQSNELYHLVHQCNDWVAEVLRAGGVNVPPLFEITPASLALGVATTGKTGRARDEPRPSQP